MSIPFIISLKDNSIFTKVGGEWGQTESVGQLVLLGKITDYSSCTATFQEEQGPVLIAVQRYQPVRFQPYSYGFQA